MFFRQFRIPDMGCASYMVGSEGVCAVIDPQWDIEPYLRIAKKEGLSISHIIETHVHADHVSGNRRLAQRSGARIYLHRASNARYDYLPLEDGQKILIGQVKIEVINTPGHTPESIMLKVTDLEQPQATPYLLTGDTIFVGDVGRPDLAGTEGAAQLFHSLAKVLPDLAPASLVYPAHLAGSLCGRNLSAAHSSTLEAELKNNAALQIKAENDFVHYLMDDLPPKPADFERIIGINRNGPPLSQTVPQILNPVQVQELVSYGGCQLVDVREPEEYWLKHLLPSLNVPVFSNQFGPNIINFIPFTSDIILIANDEEDVTEAVKLLAGVGRTNVTGYILAETVLAENGSLPQLEARQVSLAELKDQPVVDVREPNEFEAGTLAGAVNIPLRTVNRAENLERLKELARSGNFVGLVCNNGQRSSIAASYLEQFGISVRNLASGLEVAKKPETVFGTDKLALPHKSSH